MPALTQDRSPDVVLQAVLSLGATNLPALDEELARVARTQPANVFLREAFYSGLRGRELMLLETLSRDRTWPADDAEANKVLIGLSRGVLGSRDPAAIERIIALAGDAATSGAGTRAAALLDGLVPTVGASRRPVQLSRLPAGWAELEKKAATSARLAQLKDVIVWPGKAGVTATAVVKPLTPAQQARFENGRTLFATVCAACHQVTGRGLDGLAPPLLDSEWVLGSPERTVRIVLHGVRGPITVLGRVHTGDMPAFGAALNDEQIASVLTYLRREWGHEATPVEPDLVQAIRAATAGHADAFSPEELNLRK